MDDSVISLLIVEDDLDFQYLIQKTIEKQAGLAHRRLLRNRRAGAGADGKRKAGSGLNGSQLKRISGFGN